jgi:hypothetical protein
MRKKLSLKSLVALSTAIIVLIAVLIIRPVFSIDPFADNRLEITVVGSTTIDVSDPTLNQMVGLNKEKLFRYLSSNAAWHVTQFDAAHFNTPGLAAMKREKQREEKWIASSFATGYVLYPSQQLQTRILLRLDESSREPQSFGHYQTAKAGQRSVELKLYDPGYVQPAYESYLVIQGKEGVSLELFEQARIPKRIFTRSAISEINSALRKLIQSKFSDSEGLDLSILEPGSVKKTEKEEMEIENGNQPGIYRVHGYVNPRQKGYIFLKVINLETHQEVLLPREQKYTVEYIGWSNNQIDKFNFNVEAFCKRGDWSHEFPAEFQVWFHPSNGDPERMLLIKERRIYGWQR